jgi:hypothetical protein
MRNPVRLPVAGARRAALRHGVVDTVHSASRRVSPVTSTEPGLTICSTMARWRAGNSSRGCYAEGVATKPFPSSCPLHTSRTAAQAPTALVLYALRHVPPAFDKRRPTPPTPEEQEKTKRRERALDAWPWARAQVDRLLAERRAKRAEARFRALVEQKMSRRLMAPPLSGPN